jgi:type I restriction-modification system DNA methylase subunit
MDAKKSFDKVWERVDQNPADDEALLSYREARDTWVQTVLRDVMGWQDSLIWGEVAGVQAQSPNHNVTITPQGVLADLDGNNAALVYLIDPVESLRETPNDGWAATPIDRMEALLLAADVPIGIVTDGRWWGLVSYKAGTMPASGVVDSITWIEEPRTRDAFLTILGRQYLIGGDPEERLPVLFEESIAAAEEITEALGVQVRSAVELLVQAFSESALEAESRGQPDPLPERSRDAYEAAVTIMMRTVFLLFAEERGMLPAGELFEQSYGLVGRLERLSRREAEEGEEALDTTSMTWHRLLATSSAIYSGATFENLRMPAYGGSLFDPARFPWLTATTDEGMLAMTVSDRVMLHVLRSVQLAQLKAGEARQISFRDIDVEQIGYIYEGLLGYTATRVNDTYVGLKGAAGAEPEIPLSTLEKLHQENPDPKKFATELLEWLTNDQPAAKAQSATAIAKGLNVEIDPSLVSALSQAVGGNGELRDRIKPFLGIIRQDLRSHPFVVLPGGLLLKETPSRKNAGAHYTPKSLAEEVVLHALQPLCYSPGPHQTGDEAEWKLRPSEEILDLKVADIACGSGAFLVAAARYLADRVIEAWIAEDPDNAHRKDLHLRAIRQVVANCLYGADINEMAVEMAKLSLWLVSLDRDLPFSFVDDKIFLGNSLLGLTSLDQLQSLHIDPTHASGQDFLSDVDVDVDAVIRKAIELRERLASEIDEDDPMRSTTAKRRQYEQFQTVTKELRLIADGIIAAGLPLGGKPGNALDDVFQNLRLAVKKAQPQNVGGEGDTSWLDSIIGAGLKPSVETDYLRWEPLHWVLEAPDVMIDHGGFDSIVGNPPFLGGQKLTGSLGTNIRDWLINVTAEGRRGSADLVAYFFLRAMSLLRGSGTLGLIATNSIAQGDTREVGLDAMVENGFTIMRAIQSRSWPAASANLEYAAVWGTRVAVPSSIQRVANEIQVTGINTLLEAGGRVDGLPKVLIENVGFAFQGCNVLGEGFVIEPDEAEAWIVADPRNRAVLFPYLNGEDLNSRMDSTPSRWVINFGTRTEAQAAVYSDPYIRIQEAVKDVRLNNRDRAVRGHPWWQFWRTAPVLGSAIAELDHVLVIARVSNSLQPMSVPTNQVFSEQLIVFATESRSEFAVLASSIHQCWAITYGSTLGAGLRYTPSNIIGTFPRPQITDRLSEIGQTLDEVRREIMMRRGLGLTKLYNRINDPSVSGDEDVDRLRQIHVELDTGVLETYGWSDVLQEHGFHEFRGVVRWTISPKARVEVLDRLLEENHRRAALEVEIGAKVKKPGKRKSSVEQEEALF